MGGRRHVGINSHMLNRQQSRRSHRKVAETRATMGRVLTDPMPVETPRRRGVVTVGRCLDRRTKTSNFARLIQIKVIRENRDLHAWAGNREDLFRSLSQPRKDTKWTSKASASRLSQYAATSAKLLLCSAPPPNAKSWPYTWRQVASSSRTRRITSRICVRTLVALWSPETLLRAPPCCPEPRQQACGFPGLIGSPEGLSRVLRVFRQQGLTPFRRPILTPAEDRIRQLKQYDIAPHRGSILKADPLSIRMLKSDEMSTQ